MLQLEEKLGLLLKVTACLYLLSVRWSPHQDAIVIHARLLVMTIRPVLYYRRYGASRLELNLNTVLAGSRGAAQTRLWFEHLSPQ